VGSWRYRSGKLEVPKWEVGGTEWEVGGTGPKKKRRNLLKSVRFFFGQNSETSLKTKFKTAPPANVPASAELASSPLLVRISVPLICLDPGSAKLTACPSLPNRKRAQSLVPDQANSSMGAMGNELDHSCSLGSTAPPDPRCNRFQGGGAHATPCPDTPTVHPPNTAQKGTPKSGRLSPPLAATVFGPPNARLGATSGSPPPRPRFQSPTTNRPRPPLGNAPTRPLAASLTNAQRSGVPWAIRGPENRLQGVFNA
jgi:hypothetical protein